MKRIDANDPIAMSHFGTERFIEGDYEAAFEYFTRAAALGNVDAHYELSCLYGNEKVLRRTREKSCFI